VKNGAETGVDCGGTCAQKCPNGLSCNVGADCSSSVCFQSKCCGPKTCSTVGAECGLATDGCGTSLNCGTCASPLVCNSGKCACSATSCPLCLGVPCCQPGKNACGCFVFAIPVCAPP
jgi:hypothetical protein